MKNNTLNIIGDSLLISSNPEISGRITITGFEETINGLTSTRTVRREYRVSEDGIFWSDWLPLTVDNLSRNKYVVSNNLLIQVRYTRTGTDSTGSIEFIDIKFKGNLVRNEFVAPTIQNSIFNSVIGTAELSKLEVNLFKKLYYRGVIPNYITRGANDDINEDRDYVDLFFSIARYFSLFVRFFKRFENFPNDYDLLREQVRQYGIYFNESNISLEDLQYLAQNILNQIRQRGTVMVFKKKGDILDDGSVVPIDGEAARLLRNGEGDELLFENIPLERSGWCIGRSSPLYRGTSHSLALNKTKEDTLDFITLDDFLISLSGDGITARIQNYDGKKALILNTTGNDSGTELTGGLGRIETVPSGDAEYMTAVDSRMDYEITFAFRIIDAGTGGEGKETRLIFGVEGFDVTKVYLNDSFITPDEDYISDSFFSQDIKIFKPNVWYYVRGIIHAYSSIRVEKTKTNMGIGNNLYFNNSFVKYIIPRIQISTNDSVQVAIWDYKIRPLIYGTNILPLKNGYQNSYSLGFIQSSRILFMYARNNNNSMSDDEISDIIEKYLIPYDSISILTYIGNY